MSYKLMINGKTTIPLQRNGTDVLPIRIAVLAASPLYRSSGTTDRHILYVDIEEQSEYLVGEPFLFTVSKTSIDEVDVTITLPDGSYFTEYFGRYDNAKTYAYTPIESGDNTIIATANTWITGEDTIYVEGGQLPSYVMFFTSVPIK